VKLSKHFSRPEFACKCKCGFATVDVELIQVLERVREHFGNPVKINSSCRCVKHNKDVGGKPGSKHLRGIAADIVVLGVEPAQVYQFLDDHYPDRYGIGRYNTFTHIDVRTRKARW
jgi:uncharacterized protein YcbK (DUF882 family)